MADATSLGRTKDLTTDSDIEMEQAHSTPVTAAHATTAPMSGTASREAAIIAGTEFSASIGAPATADNSPGHSSPGTLAGASQPADAAAPPAPPRDAHRETASHEAAIVGGTELPTTTGGPERVRNALGHPSPVTLAGAS